jgi:hypothetical protein
LEQVSANSRDVAQKPRVFSSEDTVQANVAQVHKAKESSVCFSFRDTGSCSRKNCRFIHDSQSVHETKVDLSTSVSPVALPKAVDLSTSASVKTCDKFAGRCKYCNILGHKEQFCALKQEKQVAMHAISQSATYEPRDGCAVVANLVCFNDTFATSGGDLGGLSTNVMASRL